MKKQPKQPKEKTGKRMPKKLKVFLLLVLLLVVGFITTVGVNIYLNQNFMVSFYQLRCDKVSDNIRIIELADLHNIEYGEGNSKLIKQIRELHPDLIFYAGDMMNYRDSEYSVLFHLSDELSEIAPIYACFGNNELDQYLFEDRATTSSTSICLRTENLYQSSRSITLNCCPTKPPTSRSRIRSSS